MNYTQEVSKLLEKAQISQDKKNYEQELSYLSQLLEQDGQNLQFLKKISDCYLNLQKYEEANKYYNQLYELKPDETYILYKLAQTNKQLKNLEDSQQYITQALELSPNNALYLCMKGSIYQEKQQYDLALLNYDIAKNQKQENIDKQEYSKDDIAFKENIFKNERQALLNKLDSEQLINYIKQRKLLLNEQQGYDIQNFEQLYKKHLIEFIDTNLQKQEKKTNFTAQQYYKMAYDSQQTDKNLKDALKYYKLAAETDPNYANAYFGIASVQKQLLQYDQSLLNYDKFVELNPTYPDGIYNRGDIKVCLNRFDDALLDFDKAIQLRHQWPLYYCNRGKLLYRMERKEEALDDFDKAYIYSQNLEPSSRLTTANIQFIKNTLKEYRTKLIEEFSNKKDIEDQIDLAQQNGSNEDQQKIIDSVKKLLKSKIDALLEIHNTIHNNDDETVAAQKCGVQLIDEQIQEKLLQLQNINKDY